MHSNKEERCNFCNAGTFERDTFAGKGFCWQSRGIQNEFDRYRAYGCRTGKNKLLPHISAMLVPLKEVHLSTTKVFCWQSFRGIWPRMCPISVIFPSYIVFRNIAMYF